MFNCLESNDALKLKFQKLHTAVVNSINPADIIDFLFQEAVICQNDMSNLTGYADKGQQTRNLLILLYNSENPQAFVKLYAAIKKEPYLQWLIDRIDHFDQQTLLDLLQQLYISKPTGECVFVLCGITNCQLPITLKHKQLTVTDKPRDASRH